MKKLDFEQGCDVIQDLLPLYVDGCCSEGSRRIVEEHLKECAECRSALQEMQSGSFPVVLAKDEETEQGQAEQEQMKKKHALVVRKGLKKIRRRWAASLAVVILLIPVCILSWNQFWGEGICFTNLHEIAIANAFLKDLKKGDYESAFEHMDIEWKRDEWLERWFEEEELVDLEADGREYFCDAAAELAGLGGIGEFHYLSSMWQPGGKDYDLYYSIVIDGVLCYGTLAVSDGGVRYFHAMPMDEHYQRSQLGPGPQEAAVDALNMWSEHLWQHYQGCYFDPVLGEYVYYGEYIYYE